MTDRGGAEEFRSIGLGCVISHLQVILLGFQVELHNIKSHVLPPGYLVFNQPKWYFAMFSDCLNADIWFSMDQVGSQHSEQVSPGDTCSLFASC